MKIYFTQGTTSCPKKSISPIALKVIGLIFFSVLSSFVIAQNTPITGRVSIRDSALANVTIQVKNTNTYTVTDENGRFTINAPANATLVFSSVGFVTQEVAINNQTSLNIQLVSSNQQLNDVIVVGYGTQRRRNVTGAVSALTGGDVQRTPAVSTSQALSGKVQGITTRAGDARPGAGIGLQIRNLGTPLYVIDGIPSDEGLFNQLGINDIENISILKDAAAAIYGLRASNGVVLVTTVKGRANQRSSINISGYYGLQNFTRYPQPADAYQYLRGRTEAVQNTNTVTGNQDLLPITKEELNKWQLGSDSGYQSYDYLKMIMRPNVPQSFINASASGGSDKITYFLSGSRLDQEALIKDFRFNRTNIQSNIEAKVTNRLKVGTQISGRIEDRHQTGVPGTDDYFNPFLSILSMWPVESPYANNNPNYINGNVHNINVNPATYDENVTGYTDDIWSAIRANVTADYDFGGGLTARGVYSTTYTARRYDCFEYTYNGYTYNPATDMYSVSGGNQNPYRQKTRANIKEQVAQLQLNYTKRFGSHTINALAGYERSNREYTELNMNSNPPNNYIPIMRFQELTGTSDIWDKWAREGYIARVNYNYKEKYLLEALGRYDGSFIFPKGQRFGFFPGISAGWRISEESFLKDKISWLNDLKIRASYGQTGQDQFTNNGDWITGDPFAIVAGATTGAGSAVFNGALISGTAPRGLPVTNLTWITNSTTNIGIDITLFKNKLAGSFDVFERKRTGIPAGRYDVLIPSEVGYGLPAENLNSDLNRGIEGILTYRDKAGSVDYSIGVNATLARFRDGEHYKPRFGSSWDQYRYSIEDRWGYASWGYHVVGRFESMEDVAAYTVNNDGQNNRTQLPGDFKYEDVNGDKVIDGLDERPIGYQQGATPYMSFGINGSASYKGFTLQVDFAGASMQSFQRDWELRIPFQNNGNSPANILEDRWHRADPFDPNSAWIAGKYPAVRYGSNPNFRFSDFWLTNITYLRLKNLTLGYNLPGKVVKKLGINALRVYVNGTNLFSFDNMKEYQIDPEISSTNGFSYPQQRLYNFGFNLTL